jgi:hypothetical protein
MKTLPVAILLAALTTACGGPDLSPPHHLVLVADLQRPADATPQLEGWMGESLTAAGSTFRVCAPSADAGGARCTAAITVPAQWGANVLEAKAAFRARSLREIQDAAARPAAWQVGRSVELPADTVLFAADRTSFPVDLAHWRGGGDQAPHHLMLLCDRSPSIGTADACNLSSLGLLYDRWLARAESAGSSLTILRIGRDLSTTAELFSVQTPGGSPAARLLTLLDARARLAALPLDDRGHDSGSAIAETLFVAADRLRTRTGTKEIGVLSDGRQLSEALDFDAAIPAPDQLIAAMRKAGLAPDLRHVAVGLCGFHFGGLRDGARPLAAANADQARRSAWTGAITAFGAAPVHVATRCSDLPNAQSMEETP